MKKLLLLAISALLAMSCAKKKDIIDDDKPKEEPKVQQTAKPPVAKVDPDTVKVKIDDKQTYIQGEFKKQLRYLCSSERLKISFDVDSDGKLTAVYMSDVMHGKFTEKYVEFKPEKKGEAIVALDFTNRTRNLSGKFKFSYNSQGAIDTLFQIVGKRIDTTILKINTKTKVSKQYRKSGSFEEQVYDQKDRLTRQTEINDIGEKVEEYTYQYDDRNVVIKSTYQPYSKGVKSGDESVSEYIYNADKSLKQRKTGDNRVYVYAYESDYYVEKLPGGTEMVRGLLNKMKFINRYKTIDAVEYKTHATYNEQERPVDLKVYSKNNEAYTNLVYVILPTKIGDDQVESLQINDKENTPLYNYSYSGSKLTSASDKREITDEKLKKKIKILVTYFEHLEFY